MVAARGIGALRSLRSLQVGHSPRSKMLLNKSHLRGSLRFLRSLFHSKGIKNGGERNRTSDPGLMSPLLYQLSYAAMKENLLKA